MRKPGARVVVASRRAELLEQVASELREQHGVEAVAVPADVSDERSVVGLVAAAVDAFGTVDILVNNAGTTLLRPLLEHTLADWQPVIDVNLTGSFLAAREAARVMVPKRSGSIVNISSIFAQGATSEYPVVSYYASKGGVEGLTKALAVELGPHNVRVNAIAPGFFPRRCRPTCSPRASSATGFAARCSCHGPPCRRCPGAPTSAGPSASWRATSRRS